MPIKFLYSLFCLLTGVLSAMSSRAAGPGVINLLPSDYRAANKNWAARKRTASTSSVTVPPCHLPLIGEGLFCS